MPVQSPNLPTTEEHPPPTDEEQGKARPVLLAAFPRQVAVALPAPGQAAGRVWLETHGICDPKISGEHLRFTRAGGVLYVEDLGSRNGTFIDGYKLTARERVPLDDGAVLRIGGSLLLYREAFEGSPAPEPPLGRLVGPWGLTEIRAGLKRLAPHPNLNVLIEGETGTGKELLAEEIARVLGRGGNRFIPVNVAAIAPNLFEGHLFGWEKGAFTGSVSRSPGLFRDHAGGTVFLDEIEALPKELQPKLLRFLQQREVFPMGATSPSRVDLLIIAATNRPMKDMLQQDAFRRDLAARFQVHFKLPLLEERAEDIYAIFEAVWQSIRIGINIRQIRVDVEAIDLLMRYDWPANVRELERLVMAVDPSVGLKLSFVQQVLGVGQEVTGRGPPLTREHVDAALTAAGGVKSKAAKILKISRPQLLRWLKKHERR
ncbi:MAG: sigma 54-interacting transcriptional regulator [Polyangiaceae bacterium]|nr:sigma 54-interacting transcriptional regulator [Polyangiaceae bacterium]